MSTHLFIKYYNLVQVNDSYTLKLGRFQANLDPTESNGCLLLSLWLILPTGCLLSKLEISFCLYSPSRTLVVLIFVVELVPMS